MPRFAAIEGLRAWLAWSVVLWHLLQVSGIPHFGGWAIWVQHLGNNAVLAFIVISGFVIAGLVVDKAEPWPRYIVRRGFRIFPVYLVIFSFALFILPYGIEGASQLAWSGEDTFYWDEALGRSVSVLDANPAPQLLLHYTLFQGVVPDSIWPGTASAVLGPAWSLSLEWQFYLVAPAMVWLATQARYRMAFVVGVALLAIAYRFRIFGAYDMGSVLPMAAYIFLIGIFCRLYLNRIRAMTLGPEVVPFALMFGVLMPDLLWLGIWLAFLAYLACGETWSTRTGKRHGLGTIMDAMFASRIAVYLGARSYSVYLVHMPLILASTWLLTTYADLAYTQERIALAVCVLLATLVISDILYRVVEKPMIRLGARLAGTAAAKPAPAAE